MSGPAATLEAAGSPHLRRVARAGGASMVGAGVSAVAGIGTTLVITNGFDVATAGTIFAATALFLVATAVVQLGADVGLVRALPGLVVGGRFAHVRRVTRAALLAVLGVSVAVGTTGFLLAEDVAGVVAPEADTGQLELLLRVLCVWLPVAAVYNVLLAATRGLRTMTPTVALESLTRSVGQVAAVALAVWLGWGAVGAVAAWALPFLPVAVLAAAWWAKLLHRGRPGEAAGSDPATSSPVADYWRFTGPRALATVSQMVLKRIDIVLVAALRSPAEAALYAAATRFVVVGQLGVQALQQALGPHLSAMFASGEHAAARETYRVATAWSMLLAWPVYLGCAVLAPELLLVFGDGYGSVAPVVVLLCLTMLVATGCGAVDTVLLMSGHTWLSLVNNVSALTLNLVLNLLLIPPFGVLGAGVAWAVAIVVRNLLPLAQVSWKYRIAPTGRETVTVATAALVAVGALPGTARWAGAPTEVVAALVAVGCLGFAALMWRMRGVLRLAAFGAVLTRRRRRGAPRRPRT